METIELLKKMISIPSFSGNEERVADLMVATWAEHGYSAERSGNNVWGHFRPVFPPYCFPVLLAGGCVASSLSYGCFAHRFHPHARSEERRVGKEC